MEGTMPQTQRTAAVLNLANAITELMLTSGLSEWEQDAAFSVARSLVSVNQLPITAGSASATGATEETC